MKYTKLGKSDLNVSKISLGCMGFGGYSVQCSMGGGRFGQTISAIARLAPNSVIEEGLDITYSSYDEKRIDKWIEDVLK